MNQDNVDIEVDVRTDIFKNDGSALGSKQAIAFDCTELKDMHRYVLSNCAAICSYLIGNRFMC